MKNFLQTLLVVVFLFAAITSNAQSKLIHYWHFNNFTTVAGYMGLPANATITVNSASPYSVHADYSRIDTAKARIVYMTSAGTSSVFSTTIDYVLPGDTANARLGHASDTSIISAGLRPRNRCDSMELRWYIPTAHYKNILIKYESQSSSTASGPLHQVFDYSIDSGATWKTSGLSVASDSAGLAFGPVFPVTFTTDTTVNNNPKLVFRIKFVGNSSGTSGNNRFDNITVEGDTISGTTPPPPATSLIHYWHFNNLLGAWHNPNIPVFKADWSAIDTNKTGIAYKTVTGTSSAYAGYVDDLATGTADSDVYNLRTIAGVPTPAGNAYRFRNPTDSAYLVLYIPSTNYKNLVFSYAVEASSVTSGMHYNNFSYSTDSGATWKTVGLDHTMDSTYSPYDFTAPVQTFKLITVNFTSADTTVNNNKKLAFRIIPSYNTSLTSGNNRFDNFALDGVKIDTTHVDVPTITSNTTTPVLYPNPAGNNLYINAFAEGEKSVIIYNITGQRVAIMQSADKIMNISTSQLTPGMYYVNVRLQSGEVFTMKFIKN